MGTISLMNLGFWQCLATIVDIIPKFIYFLYAAIVSAVDAMQALIRKLAGLDVYYQTQTGEAVSGTDPLTEFIYGILGFGESSHLYEALNTVFWSLAIFGLIVLAVTTMAAIIKSHYNEDSTQTSPWKYLYTALKSILTFAVMPVLVIVGLQLSSFVLKTLDNITAGAGGEGEITAMFGSQALGRFQSSTKASSSTSTTEIRVYANYDFFGYGDPSTTTTFSGMLFKSATYSANRLRNGSYSYSQVAQFFRRDGGVQIFAASDSDFPQSGSNSEKNEYVAQQVDYLFANNIRLKASYSYSNLTADVSGYGADGAPIWSVTDWFKSSSIESFTKFNVSLVWVFYNLWQFNFIVGFVGVFVVFSIMISIIMGLMTRLIKGAALFLIYPALLGIAPLDNFKAFKGWGTQFMQQLMMAFGSIIGINLLMLILPYVQNISFFNNALIDSIINIIMLVVGLMMAKDFISMVAGFVGGADAVSTGEGFKGSIGGKLKAGVKPAAAAVGGAARGVGRAGMAVGKATVNTAKAGKALVSAIKNRNPQKAANKQADKAKKANTEGEKFLEKIISREEDVKAKSYNQKVLEKAKADAMEKASKQGLSKDQVDKAGIEAYNKMLKKLARDQYSDYKAATKGLTKQDKKWKKASTKEGQLKEKYKLILEDDGKYKKSAETQKITQQKFKDAGKAAAEIGLGLLKDTAKIGASIADSMLKTINSTASGFGLDKAINEAKGIFHESLTFGGQGGLNSAITEGKKMADESKFALKGPDKTKEKEVEDKSKAKTEALDRDTAAANTAAKQYRAQTATTSAIRDLIKTTEKSNQATANAIKELADQLKGKGGGGGSSSS